MRSYDEASRKTGNGHEKTQGNACAQHEFVSYDLIPTRLLEHGTVRFSWSSLIGFRFVLNVELFIGAPSKHIFHV